jgi:hypothetical protein
MDHLGRKNLTPQQSLNTANGSRTYHTDDGAGGDEGNKAAEERALLVLLVVLLGELLARGDHLKGNQLEATLLEPADDLGDEATLDTVRLNTRKTGMFRIQQEIQKTDKTAWQAAV